MKKPKILLICDVKNWGGWERAERIRDYCSDEFDFDMMDQAEFDEFEEKSDTHFLHLNEVHHVIDQHHKYFTKKRVSIPELLKFKKNKATIERDFDLYYLMFHTMLCQQQVKRMMYAGCKFVSAVTGMPVIKEVFGNEKYAGQKKAFKYLANTSAGFVANNNISLKSLKEIYNGPVFYTPRGVNPDIFYPMKEYENKWNVRTETGSLTPFKAVFVGKADSGKGLGEIRSICNQAKTSLIENQRNYTNALSKDHMRQLYNKANVIIINSTTDGTPNPALEAAACGLPVITNPIGNMPEFIEDGKNGFLIEEKEPTKRFEEYIKKVKWLRNNREKAKAMGLRARQTILDGWTWKHAMEYERKAIRGFLEQLKNENGSH